jgi:hypothetical protein
MEAYQTAQDPTEWDAGQADARAAKEEREAAEAEDVDELEDEEEEVTGGKRKRSAGGKKEKKKKARTSKKKVIGVLSQHVFVSAPMVTDLECQKGVSSAEPPESEEDTPAPKKKAPTKPKSKPAKAPESKPAAADKEPADDGEFLSTSTEELFD